MGNDAVFAWMSDAWAGVAARFGAYNLVLPGSPTFICKAEACTAHCCRVYSVSLGEPEVERLEKWSGLTPIHFLESEDGEPLTLPLAQPYLLSRSDGHCSLLGDDLRCSQYHGRPDACRLYPYFVVAISTASGKPVYSNVAGIRSAATGAADGTREGDLVPLLLSHVECPGFTGPPLPALDWRTLLLETAALQYPADGYEDGERPSEERKIRVVAT